MNDSNDINCYYLNEKKELISVDEIVFIEECKLKKSENKGINSNHKKFSIKDKTITLHHNQATYKLISFEIFSDLKKKSFYYHYDIINFSQTMMKYFLYLNPEGLEEIPNPEGLEEKPNPDEKLFSSIFKELKCPEFSNQKLDTLNLFFGNKYFQKKINDDIIALHKFRIETFFLINKLKFDFQIHNKTRKFYFDSDFIYKKLTNLIYGTIYSSNQFIFASPFGIKNPILIEKESPIIFYKDNDIVIIPGSLFIMFKKENNFIMKILKNDIGNSIYSSYFNELKNLNLSEGILLNNRIFHEHIKNFLNLNQKILGLVEDIGNKTTSDKVISMRNWNEFNFLTSSGLKRNNFDFILPDNSVESLCLPLYSDKLDIWRFKVKTLGNFISSRNLLEEINLSNLLLGDFQTNQLLEFLKNLKRLKILILRNNRLRYSNNLPKFELLSLENFKHLDLSQNMIELSSLEIILQKSNYLSFLSISLNKTHNLNKITELFKPNPKRTLKINIF